MGHLAMPTEGSMHRTLSDTELDKRRHADIQQSRRDIFAAEGTKASEQWQGKSSQVGSTNMKRARKQLAYPS